MAKRWFFLKVENVNIGVITQFNRFLDTLLEASKTSQNISNVDDGRRDRAKNVVVNKLNKSTPSTAPKDKPLPKGWTLREFEVESQEKTEGKIHKGYVVMDRNKTIKDISCSCKDFLFKWRYALGTKDFTNKQVYPDYEDPKADYQYNGEKPIVTNPGLEKKVCKHLKKVLDEIYG